MAKRKRSPVMGRPPKYGKTMGRRVTIRLSEEVLEKIEECCESKDISKSEFIQQLIENSIMGTENTPQDISNDTTERSFEKNFDIPAASSSKQFDKAEPVFVGNRKMVDINQQLLQQSKQMMAYTMELLEGSSRLVDNRNKESFWFEKKNIA